MHLLLGTAGLILSVICLGVAGTIAHACHVDIVAGISSVFSHLSFNSLAFDLNIANVQSVDQMLQGLKQNQLWDEGDGRFFAILAEYWRWIVYAIFLVLLVLLINSIRSGHKRKSFNVAGLHHDILASELIHDGNNSQGLYDSLTGLPNRTLFLDRLQHAININARNQKLLAVAIIDLDQFKRINDTLGNKAGDRILKIVSERFLEVVRKSDTIARLGGDEFIVLVQGFNEAANVVSIVEKMVCVLNEPVSLNGEACKVGASVSMSIFPEHGDNSEDLLRRADLAMYKAKYTGDSILMYDESFDVLEGSLQG